MQSQYFILCNGNVVTLNVCHPKALIEPVKESFGTSLEAIPTNLTQEEYDALVLVQEGKLKPSLLSKDLIHKADTYGLLSQGFAHEVAYLYRFLVKKLDQWLEFLNDPNKRCITFNRSKYHRLKIDLPDNIIPFAWWTDGAIMLRDNVLAKYGDRPIKDVKEGDDTNKLKWDLLIEDRYKALKAQNLKKIPKLKIKAARVQMDSDNISQENFYPEDVHNLFCNDVTRNLIAVGKLKYLEERGVECNDPIFHHDYETLKTKLKTQSIIKRTLNCTEISLTILNNLKPKKEIKSIERKFQVGPILYMSDGGMDNEISACFSYIVYGFVKI